MIEQETIPCAICRKPTPMMGTKRCDACWELENRLGGKHAEMVLRFCAKPYKVRVLPGAGDGEPTDYEIHAASQIDARVIAFCMDGGMGRSKGLESGHVELVKMYTEVLP